MKLFRKAVLISYWFLFTQILIGQTDSLFLKAEELRESREYKKALPFYYQYRQVSAGKLTIREDAMLAYKMAACYFNLSDYDSTEKYMNHALTQKSKIVDRSDTFLLSAHAVMGYIYRYEKPNVRRASQHFDDQRSIMDAYPDRFNSLQLYNNYFNLASTNRELKDYDRALNYAYKSLSIAQTITDNPQLAENCYLVIANSLSGKGQYEQAEEFYQKKLDKNIEQRGKKHASLILDYYNIAINNNDINKPNRAINFFRQAEIIATKYEPSFLPNIYRGLGISYRLMGKRSISINYLSRAISPEFNPPLNQAWGYRQIALHYEQQQQYDSAIHNYQRAFQAIIKDFRWTMNSENPSLNQLKVSNPFTHTILKLKANCYFKEFEANKNVSSLKNAANAYDLLDQLTDQYRDDFVLESSRLFFQQKNHQVYDRALQVNYELYGKYKDYKYIEKIWNLLEKNKSFLLLEDLLNAETEVKLEIPDSVLEYRRVLSERLLKAQKDLTLCEYAGKCTESELITLRNTLSNDEDELRKLQIQIQKQFKDYYDFTEGHKAVDIKKLQSQLDEEQAVINYFESDQFYYLVTIDNKTVSLDRISRDSQLSDILNGFLSEVSGETLRVNGIKQSFDNFSETAYKLYNYIIPKRIKSGEFEKLVIIPDGKLAGIPFEALIQSIPKTNSQDFSQLDYLINNYSINYGFSATLWIKNQGNLKYSNNKGLVAFGTSDNDIPGLAKLSSVKEEMNHLKTIRDSQIYEERNATESNFKKQADNAGIIHLALHNINDYENPLNSKLIFRQDNSEQDSELFLYEIFGIPMTPSLVVLSSCETGVGKWMKGEGAYHMGRGFLYHGNPALIMSLWKVRDVSAAKIMGAFYSEFETNNSAESIRNAKLTYLSSSDPLASHPSNWAAFVSIGSTTSGLEASYKQWIWLVLAAIFMFAVLKTVLRQKDQRTAS